MTSIRFILVAALLAGGLAGCAADQPIDAEKAASYDYRLKHPLSVTPSVAVLQLSGDAHGLAPADRPRVTAFAAEFVRRGSGQMEVSVGAGEAADAKARGLAQEIAATLLEEGLKVAEIKLQLVLDEPTLKAGQALARFQSTTVQLPECYDWRTGDGNAPYANFGCSIQRNIGSMVSNPKDLAEGRPPGAVPAVAASVAIDKLNQGQGSWSVALPLSAAIGGGK